MNKSRAPFRVALFILVLVALNVLIHFPYHFDQVAPPGTAKKYVEFYGKIYSAPKVDEPEPDDRYVVIARQAIKANNIVPRIEAFVRNYGLEDKRVLDVGAGTGYLQDTVKDYVGLDISSTAGRYYHKPYVEASATDMPLRDGTFDAVWSIWVLEHVPVPEQALSEIRRVTKDGGLLFMMPAWNCTPFQSQGYGVRPYQDFGPKDKIIKAGIPIVLSSPFRASYQIPIRILRQGYAAISGAPTHFHYRQLTPNYNYYWDADADAINSFDRAELMLWFTSRGDECLNCSGATLHGGGEVIIRVHKRAGSAK